MLQFVYFTSLIFRFHQSFRFQQNGKVLNTHKIYGHGIMTMWQCFNLETSSPHGTGWPRAINAVGQSCEVKNDTFWHSLYLESGVFHVFSISEWPGQSGSPITHIAWWNDERIWSSQGALEIFKAPGLVPGLVGDHGTILCRLPRRILPWFGYPNYMDVSPEIQELASGKLTVCYWKWP